jgi:glycosyltransferase involved in cell wall biosynthesis
MVCSTLIDVSAALNQGAGIGRYARQLTRELIPLLPPDSTRLWFAADDLPAYPKLLERPPWSALPVSRARLTRENIDRFWVRARLPVGKFLGSGRPTDSYSPDFTAPPGKRVHVTIHDLAWLHPEANTQPGLARFLDRVVDRAIERSATVFTVSEAIRTEILERYRVSEDRVVVATNAAAPHFFDVLPISEQSLVTLGVHSPFLLYVGTIEPRKNLPLLFDAMSQLGDDLNLVVVGKKGWEAKEQLDPIERLGLRDRVVVPGYVTEEVLAGLYASAAAVVYPSRYEGFGLPVVEGLAAGAAVVASNLPVFREVGGNAAIYFDPTDAASLASAIERATSSESDHPELRQQRRAQAKTFDWRASASVVASRLQEAY